MDTVKDMLEDLLPQEKCREHEKACNKVVYQYADVKVPVKIKPKAIVGEIEAKYVGEPQVKFCEGHCKEACELVISQKICIKIPISYCVETHAGPDCVDCNRPKG